MKIKSRLTDNQKKTILMIVSSLVIAGVLAFSILAMEALIDDTKINRFRPFYFASLLFLTISIVNLAFYNHISTKNKIAFFKYIAMSTIYLALSVVVIVIPYGAPTYNILCGVYMITIIANRLCKIFEKKTLFNIIYNSLLATVALIVTILIFVLIDGETLLGSMIVQLIIMFVVSLINLLNFAFSRMQLRSLLKIIRKTYAFEIVYGLLVLIISFSFVFMIFEANFETYGDAIWYSFAVVTTIGFGDFTATNPLTRVLSVILGIYGIIVVAVITSVIVNFYNEVKNVKEEDKPEIIEEKSEDEDNKQE